MAQFLESWYRELCLPHNSEFWVYQLHFEAQNGNERATGFGVRLLVGYLKKTACN